jgi:hypothetical protein
VQQIRKVFIWILVALQLFSMSGCTSTQATIAPAAGLAPEAVRESLKAGDRVEIFQDDGNSVKMKVIAIDESSVTGVGSKNERYEIPISSIEGFTTNRVSAGKTAVAVGALGVSTIVLMFILLSSLAFMP